MGSRGATHKQIVELRTDGSSGSPKEMIEDETIRNQIVVEEGVEALRKKEVSKPKLLEVDEKIKQVVEENYSRQGKQSVDSVLPIAYNVSKVDEKLERDQGAQCISSLLFATLYPLCYIDILINRI